MIVGSDKDKKKKKGDVEESKENTEEAPVSALEQLLGGPQNEIRTIGLMGDVDEEKGGDLMMAILLLTELSGKEAPYDPITMYISTYGGSADEMFGIYDVMTKAKRQCEIHTIGVGKVMSAGTLVLASGTKGKRKIGKHCRVMIHSVNSGHVGELHSIENEVKAVKHMQELYINAMAQETSMTKRQLQKLIDRKVNVYLSAEEAIEYGIADEIL
jgi:ATP-dependent Clp protease protease subunit